MRMPPSIDNNNNYVHITNENKILVFCRHRDHSKASYFMITTPILLIHILCISNII